MNARILLRLLAILLVGVIAIEPHRWSDDLRRVVPTRVIGPQLSLSVGYGDCAGLLRFDASRSQVSCSSSPIDRRHLWLLGRLQLRARRALELESGDTTKAFQILALLDLSAPDTSGKSLDEAITFLERTARRPLSNADFAAGVLVDLSAAYLVRAQRTRNARDLLEAMTAAEQALQLDSLNAPGRFNLALALDWFGLNEQARTAWRHYLVIDSTSGWAREAQGRTAALAPATAVSPPPPSASAAVVGVYVRRAPQDARLYGWDHVLGEWGAAVLEGDSTRARDRLGLASELGDALTRQGGDRTLAQAVHAIRAQQADPVATRVLAEGHVAYAAGQSAYYDVNYDAARARFASMIALRPPSPPLESWALLFHGAMLVQAGKFGAADDILRRLASRADTLYCPALAGRARWVLATARLRRGNYESALEAAMAGARLLGRAGELEHQGGAEYVAADAQYYLGATSAAYEAVHRALATLRGQRHSVWLLNALAAGARTAEADGLTLAAIRIQDERVAVASLIAHPVRIAEARLGRARLLAGAGRLAPARADIEASEQLVQTLKPGVTRTWLETELRFARAAVLRSNDPAQAAANLDAVLSTTGGSLTAARQLRARIGRAEVRLALGDVRGATWDLDTASMVLAEQRDSIARTEFRASLLDTARGVFDRLAMLRVAAGDPEGALKYLERGRVSFGPTGRGGIGPAEERPRMPSGQVAVEYALVGDTLLVWTVSDTTLRLVRQTMDRRTLVGAVEDVRLAFERGMDDSGTQRSLAMLYDWLVRPVEARLGDEHSTLVLVTDGELAALPFSALYDTAAGRYLVEEHALRHAASLRDAARAHPPRPADEAEALLVADPAFDRHALPNLEPLPGARAEVATIALSYPRHSVLSGAGAGLDAFQARLPHASVVHVAGHAVFDDQRPERSFLVLAPGRGQAGFASLTAAEMETLPLDSVSLFVLSACETLRSRSGRSGGFAGFAGALLDAGVGGVVGSLWRVDDRLTVSLMVQFHRAYRRAGDGSRALREAQLRMLRSPRPALRSPAAWAGFRYVGN